MARIVHDLGSRAKRRYLLYTDLDFWDARRILKGLGRVKRNFGSSPPGDRFPTQVVVEDADSEVKRTIEKRLSRAIASPPRHLIVQSIIYWGRFEFDRRTYCPDRWSAARVLFFVRKRLPLHQPVIRSRYKWVEISLRGNTVAIQQHQGVSPEAGETNGEEDQSVRCGPACF
ncbi:MAG: hypothetical protein ACLFVT_09575 [Syntrophobacteria bacterium]